LPEDPFEKASFVVDLSLTKNIEAEVQQIYQDRQK
jgi:hypothetical protein